MRELQKGIETDIVAGGGDPGLVCKPSTGSKDHSVEICQTSTNLTIITRTDVTESSGSGGASGSFRLFGLEIGGGGGTRTTTTTVRTCTQDGKCTDSAPIVTKEKVSDLSDGSDAQNVAFDQLGDDLGNFDAFAGGGGGEGDFGCVAIASFLPGGANAGDMTVGSTMQLSDQVSLEPGTGEVSFSKRKKAQGYRVTTVSGVTLVCSNTAPIPTPEGIVLAPELAGKKVAVRRDEGGTTQSGWEAVKSVEPVGEIEVQHITVGDKCFWAGERADAFLLHHNSKAAFGGSDESAAEFDWDSVA